jgi:hypothetical protein
LSEVTVRGSICAEARAATDASTSENLILAGEVAVVFYKYYYAVEVMSFVLELAS